MYKEIFSVLFFQESISVTMNNIGGHNVYKHGKVKHFHLTFLYTLDSSFASFGNN